MKKQSRIGMCCCFKDRKKWVAGVTDRRRAYQNVNPESIAFVRGSVFVQMADAVSVITTLTAGHQPLNLHHNR
jgi:hypothetical protein